MTATAAIWSELTFWNSKTIRPSPGARDVPCFVPPFVQQTVATRGGFGLR